MEENVFYKPGEPSSVMSLNEEVDLFASCVNIYTTETDVYGDIMDEPRELEVFDEGAWALNLATGIVATLGNSKNNSRKWRQKTIDTIFNW